MKGAQPVSTRGQADRTGTGAVARADEHVMFKRATGGSWGLGHNIGTHKVLSPRLPPGPTWVDGEVAHHDEREDNDHESH
jgi:hypothetical protein